MSAGRNQGMLLYFAPLPRRARAKAARGASASLSRVAAGGFPQNAAHTTISGQSSTGALLGIRRGPASAGTYWQGGDLMKKLTVLAAGTPRRRHSSPQALRSSARLPRALPHLARAPRRTPLRRPPRRSPAPRP